MSKFSERCKHLLLENGTNVYRLSKDFSLECTTLQRMVTGKRLPNMTFVKKFCEALRIPFSEKQNLMELYRMEQIGETVYNNRKCIKTILNNLALNEKSLSRDALSVSDSNLYQEQNILSYSFRIEEIVQTVLRKAFASKKASFIYTNFPASNFVFFHYLRTLNIEFPSSSVWIKHLINFKIDANDTIYNLNILNNVLPFVLSNQMKYHSLFCYSRLNIFDFSQIVFPYFIITADEVLLLSSDMENFISLEEEEIIKRYRVEFEKMSMQCSSLIHETTELAEALYEYKILHEGIHKPFYSIEPSICCTKVLTSVDFNGTLRNILEKLGLNADEMVQYMNTLKNTSYFSKEGLEYFCDTGKLTGQMGVLLPIMNRKERAEYLINFIEQANECYLLDDSFHLNANLNIEICDRERINIIYFDPDAISNIRFISINESSICNAFYDFIESLDCSESVYSAEQTKAEVARLLKEKFPEECEGKIQIDEVREDIENEVYEL